MKAATEIIEGDVLVGYIGTLMPRMCREECIPLPGGGGCLPGGLGVCRGRGVSA